MNATATLELHVLSLFQRHSSNNSMFHECLTYQASVTGTQIFVQQIHIYYNGFLSP